MIVHENHGGGGIADHRIVDFARVNQRSRERALGNFHVANFAVFIVEQHDVEKLALFSAETIAKMMIDVFGGTERLAGFPFLAADTFGNLETCLQLRDLRRTYAFYFAEFTGGGVVYAFEPAELIKEQPRVVDGALARAGVAVS